MSNWANVTLANLATQRKGINYKSEDYGDEHSGHPFITIKCFVKGGGYETTGIKFYDGFSTKLDHLSAGDLLFSVTDLTRAGDIVGSPLRVPDFGGAKPAVASMDCMCIEPIGDRCDKRFLYHRLMLADVRRQMVAYSAGSTVLHLDTKKVPSIVVWTPLDVRLQSKIASILDGIDNAIEKTEALIAKYQQIKAGLMHDLFTRGVLPSGQLRPPREQAPELYQETPIGWIPREWQVKRLDDLAQVARGKFTHRPRNDPAYLGGPYPFIQTGEVSAAGGGIVSDSSQSLSALGATVSQCFPEGTIAITIAANIADTAILGIPMYFPDSVVGAVVKEGCNVLFVELCVRKSKRRLDAMAPQSAQKNINLQDIRPLLIPQPDLLEQDRIAKRISAIEGRIDVETKRRNKLSFKKRGLMEDLLTGKVPVAVEEPELVDG
jgi:type I restriction enzyme, S subunit